MSQAAQGEGMVPPPYGTAAPDTIDARDRTHRGFASRLPVRVAAVAGAAVVLVGAGAVAAFAMSGGEGTTTVRSSPLADAPKPPDPSVLAEQRRRLTLDQAGRAARRDAGRPLELEAKGRTPTPTPSGGTGGGGYAGNPVPAGQAQRIARAMLPSFG
ncbi:MAG TPA: lytic transglycosylase domain-containing protein, partial [Thermomonospora sp.]|nr:lytic transglycosylase domain-containing protein [Thermomonospora sp.]